MDLAGNAGFAVRVVNVLDTLPPNLTLLGKSFVIVEAATTYTVRERERREHRRLFHADD